MKQNSINIDKTIPIIERIDMFMKDHNDEPISIMTHFSLEEISDISNGNIPDLKWEQAEILMIGFLDTIGRSQMELVEALMPQYAFPKDDLSILLDAYNCLLSYLYYDSANDAYFWVGCQLPVYIETFEVRFKEYEDKYPDADLINFIEDEITTYKDTIELYGLTFEANDEYYVSDRFGTSSIGFYANCNSDLEWAIRLSKEKKLDFLTNKKDELIFQQENRDNRKAWESKVIPAKIDESEFGKSESEIFLDYSDNSQAVKEPEPSGTKQNNLLNDFPEIFTETGFQTFKMLDEKYKKDNKKLKAKYSNLFWFLENEDLLKCTQLEYIDFIKENYSVKLSKILPKTTKYGDIIQPLLKRYFKGQQ